jgi:hypothetical protein
MSTMVRKGPSLPTLRELTERACNDPQRMRARKTEAKIIEMMPARAWLSCTAVSRLIGAPMMARPARGSIAWCATANSNASASRAPTVRSIFSGGFREQRPAGLRDDWAQEVQGCPQG